MVHARRNIEVNILSAIIIGIGNAKGLMHKKKRVNECGERICNFATEWKAKKTGIANIVQKACEKIKEKQSKTA
jgi:hypothetical protein